MGLVNVTGIWDGAALQSTPNYNAGTKGEVQLTSKDRGILRALAEKVAGYAALLEQKEKRELWRRHNDLEPTRPMVFCDPENGWNEIITTEQLQCKSYLAKRWEMVLRKELFWVEWMKDDKVIEPFFDIGYTHTEDNWGLHEKQIGGTEGGSYVWKAALEKEADVERLHPPTFDVDRDTTQETVALAKDTFGDLLQVRSVGVCGAWNKSCTTWWSGAV